MAAELNTSWQAVPEGCDDRAQQFQMKRLLDRLSSYGGDGTSVITVLVAPNTQVCIAAVLRSLDLGIVTVWGRSFRDSSCQQTGEVQQTCHTFHYRCTASHRSWFGSRQLLPTLKATLIGTFPEKRFVSGRAA